MAYEKKLDTRTKSSILNDKNVRKAFRVQAIVSLVFLNVQIVYEIGKNGFANFFS